MIKQVALLFTSPKWFPFMGCNSEVQKSCKQNGNQWKGFSALAKKYSTNILGLKLGSELVVVLFGKEYIKKGLMLQEFEGRPDNFFVRLRCFGKRCGITFTDGPVWRELRRFTVTQLHNVGFARTDMERAIQEEMTSIVDKIEKRCKEPINIDKMVATSVMNVLWRYVAGERINDEKVNNLLDLFHQGSKALSMAGGWLNIAPWSRFIFPELSGYSISQKITKQLSDVIEEAIQRHKDKAVFEKDFIYLFLQQIEDGRDNYTEDQLKMICVDLLIAGSQTTRNVLDYVVLTTLRNQEIQEKIYKEIKTTIGTSLPCWDDNNRLPFTSAFLLEVQRYYTVAPLIGPRRVLSDTMFHGYFIPKDTTVIMSVGDLNFDTEVWVKPEVFNPERFIDANGKVQEPEHFIPFGLGRRRCPGDSLAKSFIFLIFVELIQKYKIVCENGSVPPDDDPVIRIFSSPKPYSAVFVPRQDD